MIWCFLSSSYHCKINFGGFLDCWSDKTRHLKMSSRALGNLGWLLEKLSEILIDKTSRLLDFSPRILWYKTFHVLRLKPLPWPFYFLCDSHRMCSSDLEPPSCCTSVSLCSLLFFRLSTWCCRCVLRCCVCWNLAKRMCAWAFLVMSEATASFCSGRCVYGCWCCCSPGVHSTTTTGPGAEDTCDSTGRCKDWSTCHSPCILQVRLNACC